MSSVHSPTGNTGLVASSEVAFIATIFKRQVVIVVTRNVGLRSPSEVAYVAIVFKRQVVGIITGINSWPYELLKSIFFIVSVVSRT
jgi:hypothetical protein